MHSNLRVMEASHANKTPLILNRVEECVYERSKLNRFFLSASVKFNTYVTHKHFVFMTLNRNINWLKSTYVNLHCAGQI